MKTYVVLALPGQIQFGDKPEILGVFSSELLALDGIRLYLEKFLEKNFKSYDLLRLKAELNECNNNISDYNKFIFSDLMLSITAGFLFQKLLIIFECEINALETKVH